MIFFFTLTVLKKKIKNFEEEFEEVHGYKVSSENGSNFVSSFRKP